jgi:hypothetical protein
MRSKGGDLDVPVVATDLQGVEQVGNVLGREEAVVAVRCEDPAEPGC